MTLVLVSLSGRAYSHIVSRNAQAAAHGVPTVATKNGGPVDIMKTLHHGVTVDPTSSKQLGDALLSILTNHSEWERMSKAGMLPFSCSRRSSLAHPSVHE